MLGSYFVSGADAPRTEVQAYSSVAHFESYRLNIREPGTSCMLFGVAYPVPKAQSFATHIAFYSQFETP